MSESGDLKNGDIADRMVGEDEAAPPSRLRAILIVALLLAAVGGFFAWRYYSVRETTDDAQIDGHVSPVAARVGGTVIKIAVQDNQYVEAGAVLVQLDPKDYEVALERARADLAEAEAALAGSQTDVPITTTNTVTRLTESSAGVGAAQASLTTTERMVAMARARLESARATVLQIQANYDQAAKDVERFRPLVAKEEISRQQFDAAVAQADALKAGLAAAQAQVSEAEANVRTQESALNRDRERVKEAQAGEERASTANPSALTNPSAMQRATTVFKQMPKDVALAKAPVPVL